MAKFQAGSKVIMVDTQKKGIITSVSDYIRGRQFYIVNWGDYESEEIDDMDDNGMKRYMEANDEEAWD